MWIKTYGNLYWKLISTTGEIPLGLYRTVSSGNKRTNIETVNLTLFLNKKLNSLFDLNFFLNIEQNRYTSNDNK